MDSEEQRSAAIGLCGGNRPISWQVSFFAWSPGSIRHGHQPPGVIFGSYSYEVKPRSPLSLLFPPLYLYYCKIFHCHNVLASSTSTFSHNPGQHLWVSSSLLSLIIPPVLASFWHSASSFQQCLVFCPAGHTDFGGCQWEPASVVWHVDSYSLTPAPFEERALLDSEEPQPSLLAQREKTPQRLLNQNGNGRQSGAWGVRFPLSEKFTLLTFGNHTLAFYQRDLCISFWICKMCIFGLPQECFMGRFMFCVKSV